MTLEKKGYLESIFKENLFARNILFSKTQSISHNETTLLNSPEA